MRAWQRIARVHLRQLMHVEKVVLVRQYLLDADRKCRDTAEVPATQWRVEFQLTTIDQTDAIDKTVAVGVRVVVDVGHVTVVYISLCERRADCRVDVVDL